MSTRPTRVLLAAVLGVAGALGAVTLGDAPSPAQADSTGEIAGTVVSPGGVPIAGATVTVRGPAGATSTVTDGSGGFRLSGLAAGTYQLTVILADQRVERGGVVVR